LKTTTQLTSILLALGIGIVLLGACSPVATPIASEPQPTETPEIMHPVNLSRFAEDAAIQALSAQLGIERGLIQVNSTKEVNWPDACLGNPSAGAMCAQVVTPGYLILLNANGQSYEFHTNRDGTSLVRVDGEAAGQKTLVVSWQRDGGIIGFCDEVSIYTDGTAQITSCRGISREVRLTPEQAGQLEQMHSNLGVFESQGSDGAQADSMTVTLRFIGIGKQPATQADEQTLTSLVTYLMAKAGQAE